MKFENNPSEKSIEDNLENNEKILNNHFSHIRFPTDFKVERTGEGRFIVTKESVPNKVSVIIYSGFRGERKPKWEMIASNDDGGGDSLRHVDLDDYDELIKNIEKTFYFNPDDYPDPREEDAYRNHDREFDDEDDTNNENKKEDKSDYGNITPESQI